MTTTYNPAEVERLVREARAFGARDRQGLREAMADQLEAAREHIAELETVRVDLTACEEQRDVYRDRAQQMAGRVTELEAQLDSADRDVLRLNDDCHRLRVTLRSLIARVRRTGGYASPEEHRGAVGGGAGADR